MLSEIHTHTLHTVTHHHGLETYRCKLINRFRVHEQRQKLYAKNLTLIPPKNLADFAAPIQDIPIENRDGPDDIVILADESEQESADFESAVPQSIDPSLLED